MSNNTTQQNCSTLKRKKLSAVNGLKSCQRSLLGHTESLKPAQQKNEAAMSLSWLMDHCVVPVAAE